jgi:hypothetical protein
VEELSAPRQRITGEIREARALLRRLFVGFELASAAAPQGNGALRRQGIIPSDDSKYLLDFGSHMLLPALRRDAIDQARSDPAAVPAVQRLPLHSALCAFLAAW